MRGARTGRSCAAILSAAFLIGVATPASARSRPPGPKAARAGGKQPSADFNGDGYQDIAIGSIFENVNGRLNAGAVNVLYGSATGLQADGTGAPDDQFWTQDTPGVEGQAHTGNHFGFATQQGDFNQDGYDDLAIEIEFQQIGTQPNAGAVEVLYGSPTGLQADGTGGPDDQLWAQDSPGVQDQSETADAFGRALASSDFNGDGYADLAIGVKGERTGGPSRAANGGKGIVQILYGSATGLQADGIGAPDDQLWSQDSPGVQDKAENGDLFGRSLGAGDFNGDGFGDLAIGAYDEKIDRIREAGAVNVLYGGPNGLQADNPDDQFWYQGVNGLADTPENGDEFGRAITTGDFNADGYADVALSARREDVGTVNEAGSVSVLYGTPSGLQADGIEGPDDQFWTQDSPGVQDQCEQGDWFGMTVVAADFNADGYDDLAVGARFEDVGPAADAGSVNVLYGSATGLQADGTGGPDDQFWTQDSAGVLDQAEPGDRYGQSIAAADWNADGYADLAFGGIGEDLGGIVNVGGVVVLYGLDAGLQADSPANQFWNQDSPGVQDQAEQLDGLGWSLTGTTS
jgi:FG-GAP repeat protein